MSVVRALVTASASSLGLLPSSPPTAGLPVTVPSPVASPVVRTLAAVTPVTSATVGPPEVVPIMATAGVAAPAPALIIAEHLRLLLRRSSWRVSSCSCCGLSSHPEVHKPLPARWRLLLLEAKPRTLQLLLLRVEVLLLLALAGSSGSCSKLLLLLHEQVWRGRRGKEGDTRLAESLGKLCTVPEWWRPSERILGHLLVSRHRVHWFNRYH